MDQATNSELLLKVALDVTCLLLVGFPILMFYLYGSPYERGFFCDDESLMHPFKDSTVPTWVLYVFGLGIPIATIVLTEYVLARNRERSYNLTILKYSISVPLWIENVYKYVGVFGFGAATSQLTTDICKYAVGRLRPHFFDVCDPDINCSLPENYHRYITRFQCRKSDPKLIKDMRLSFPSGHSSFSMYCMLFFAMYIQSRFSWKHSTLAKHVLQFLALSLAIATAMSRISDYKHHWSDVLSGFLLGSAVAIIIVIFVSDLFPSAPPLPVLVVTDDPESSTSPTDLQKIETVNAQQMIL